MYALNLSDDGRILSATFEEFAASDQPIVDSLPDGDISNYRYVSGEYIYDPLPKPVLPEPPLPLESRVATLEIDSAETKEALEMILAGVTE